jgi:hypothetical protein
MDINTAVSFNIRLTLLGRVDDIVDAIVDPFDHVTTLAELALIANSGLDDFAVQFDSYQLGNILLIDQFQTSNIMKVVKAFNARNCQDNILYLMKLCMLTYKIQKTVWLSGLGATRKLPNQPTIHATELPTFVWFLLISLYYSNNVPYLVYL